ncbi:outer membrane protein [Devosia sp.]|jgi:outer membrane autotransporter protein|uniref:outer membrane protein n=1 Tax=Devosia sp. TaxID=1871048 RepID=UPI0037C0D639
MRTLKLALLATAATVAFSSATFAADLIVSEPAMIDNTVGFDWEGPYVGLWLGGQTTPSVYSLGANLGVNVMLDQSLLAGFEGEIAWLSDSSYQGDIEAKLGFVADVALIYAHVGVGSNSATGAFVPVGVGAEFAVADNVSLKAEYTYQWDFDNAAQSAHVGKIGINFHF